MYTQATGQTFTLGQDVIAGSTYATLDFVCEEAPLLTEGVIKVNSGEQSEWMVFTAFTQVSGTTYRATISYRGLEKDATSFSDVATANQKDHGIGTPATFVTHSLVWNEKIQQDGDNTWTGDNTVTGSMSFTGTTEAGLVPQSVTTAQRDALTGVSTGQYLYNSTTATGQTYDGAAWDSLATGSTNQNATETTAGKVKLGTVTNQEDADLDTNVVQTRYLVSSFDQVTPGDDAYKIAILGAGGTYDPLFFPSDSYKFGGTGADGALTATSQSIAGEGYFIKNYTRISGPTSISFTGTEVIAHIKVQGDCDLTNCTIDLKGKGAAGGAGGTMNINGAPNVGTTGSSGSAGLPTLIQSAVSPGGTGGQAGSAAAVSAGATIGMNKDFMQAARTIIIHTGNGGGGGGGAYNDAATGGGTAEPSGGAGSRGGGCLILEVGGNLTMTGATIDVRGNDGSTGVNGNVNYNGGGGGGGGAGGCSIILYNGTLTGSPTISVTGGAGGTGGIDGGAAGYSGAGGAGGSSASTTGSSGAAGTAASGGGTGGAGASGVSVLASNQVWS